MRLICELSLIRCEYKLDKEGEAESREEPNDWDVKVNGEYTREKGEESCSLHKAE